MASKSGKGYSASDIALLKERARSLCFQVDYPSTANANWLLEGAMGQPVWVTRNSGKEYFDSKWRNAVSVNFDVLLPNSTSLADPSNKLCYDAVQKWSFAYRSGWLGPDPSPKYWQETSRWVLSFTSWVYFKSDEFFPQEFGFSLLKEEDIQLLFEQLTVDGWASALKLIDRSFAALHHLAFGCVPSLALMEGLPYVPSNISREIVAALDANDLFIKNTSRDQRLICRKFLGSKVGVKVSKFTSVSIRKFLRQFEFEGDSPTILIPGHASSRFPRSTTSLSMDEFAVQPPTKAAMALHATHCTSFLLSAKIPAIGIPDTGFDHDSIAELKARWQEGQHRNLIPLNEALAVLNEAACWISQYGNDLLDLYEGYLTDRLDIVASSDGRSKEYWQVRTGRAYKRRRAEALERELSSNEDKGMFARLGLQWAVRESGRTLIPGNLTLAQALFVLIGACAYAIGMMKPLRDEELASIPFDCVLRNNKNSGCFAEFPVEKSAKQGMVRTIIRPIPYFTYLAIALMQRLAIITTKAFGIDSPPPRLFYYPSGLGFDYPLNNFVSLSINRCMDIFCDFVDFPVNSDGSRSYYRIHELRKFFLLMLAWDDPEHGFECGAWMAGHRNPEYIKAYTDSNVSGAEITTWEAEQVELKLLKMEMDKPKGEAPDDLRELYSEMLKDLRVSAISGLTKAKFESYIKGALEAGRYTVRLMTFEASDGSHNIDFGVFVGEAGRD